MIVTKVLGGLSLSLAIAVGVLGWQLKGTLEDLGAVEAQYESLQHYASSMERTYDDLKKEYDAVNESLAENEEQIRQSEELIGNWRERYEIEKAQNELLSEWAANEPPAIWWDGVRGAVQDLNRKRSGEASTSE